MSLGERKRRRKQVEKRDNKIRSVFMRGAEQQEGGEKLLWRYKN